MKRLGMVLLGLMFWSMNTLAQVTGSLDPEENCYIGNANVYGKYSELIQRFDCPADMRWYPKFKDDGFWGGDGWHCERETVYNGYWVWVSPTWFVWESRNRPGIELRPEDKKLWLQMGCDSWWDWGGTR